MQVTCIRCGHNFTPADEDITLVGDEEAVVSAKCPSCGKRTPVPDF